MADWYLGSTKWTAAAAWAAATSYNIGDFVRQNATPSVDNERVWRCTTSGTSGGTEPTWTLTKGSTTADNTAIWTEVTGNSTYGWSAAHARLKPALAWMAAGDRLFVSNAHAETVAATVAWAPPGTKNNPNQILCVSDAAAPPTALSNTATITITSNHTYSFQDGAAYFQGITFGTSSTSAAYGFVHTSLFWFKFVNCQFNQNAATGSPILTFGSNSTLSKGQVVELVNTRFSFTQATGRLEARCRVIWTDTPNAIITGRAPNIMFNLGGSGISGDVTIRGVDFSEQGAAQFVLDASGETPYRFRMENCKLSAAGGIVNTTSDLPFSQGGCELDAVNIDSGDTNYKYYKARYQGQITQETVIVRTGGASDGTTTVSRKMVTGTGASFVSPLVSDPCLLWNDSVGSSITATIEVVTDGVTLTDAEAWIEAVYLGTDGFPLSVATSDRKATVLATAADQTLSTTAWTTTGLTSPVRQKLEVAITPEAKGIVAIRVYLARASTTMYFDPKVTIS